MENLGQSVLCITFQLTGTVCAIFQFTGTVSTWYYISAYWDSLNFVVFASFLVSESQIFYCSFILFKLSWKILVRGRACHPTSVKIGAMAPSCVKISEMCACILLNCLFLAARWLEGWRADLTSYRYIS